MYDNKGLPVQCSGGYLLGKNNDRMKTFLLSPTTTSISSQSEACYIDFYKSIHEEITATFDTMKFRWRILTENFHSYSMSFVQDIVHTCCILHNMCLSFDDLHDFDWEEAHPNTTDNDIYLSETSCTETTISLHDVDVLQTTPSSKRRSYLVQKKSHYQKLNNDLLKHFQHQYANKLLCFPKRFPRELKIKHSSDLNYHITRSSGPVLYIKESTIKYGIKTSDGCITYIGNCGKGLFSRNFIRKNEYIATFIGIEVEGLSSGNIVRIINAGFDTIPKIIKMTIHDFLRVEGFKETLATKIYNGIREKLNTASLVTIMSGTNLFGRGFGEKTIELIMVSYPDVLLSKESCRRRIERSTHEPKSIKTLNS
jgi:hypothetical protein